MKLQLMFLLAIRDGDVFIYLLDFWLDGRITKEKKRCPLQAGGILGARCNIDISGCILAYEIRIP